MSEISRELREQQEKSIPEALKKIFGDIPVIDAQQINDEERKQLERAAIERLSTKIGESR